jgi:hypothetical protein
MDLSNIHFDPSKFKTRLEEKPFKDALEAQLDGIASSRPVRGPKQLEIEFGLPINSFLTYKKHALEPKQELAETMKRKKPNPECSSFRQPDISPLILPNEPNLLSLPLVPVTPPNYTDEE